MNGFTRFSLLAGLTAVLAAASFAQTIPGGLLQNANAGEKSVAQLLDDKGYVADVTSAQLADQLFQKGIQENSFSFSSLWSQAGLAGRHRVGVYDPGNPMSVSWILGNVLNDGNQVTSWTGSIEGPFGLVLDNGIGDRFYSETALNTDNLLMSDDPALNGFDQRNHVVALQNQVDPSEIIFSWEDLQNPGDINAGGYLDYNDFGMSMRSSANPVPEPGTMLALGLGAAAFAARRKKKQA